MQTSEQFHNFAFISYSHRDMSTARWLQKRLESFRLPTEVHNDIEAGGKYIRPVFRDQSDLNTGILSDELRRNLEQSKFLILICSEHSASSQWVSEEARAFVEMGRLDRIIPVILPSGDTSERELFPIFLREYFVKNPDKELLGINIGEVGKEKALIRIVSKMLGVSFDSLWKRYLRKKRTRIISATFLSLILAAIAYLFAIPVNLDIDVSMQKGILPFGEDLVLRVDSARYLSSPQNPHFDIIRIPGYKRLSDIRITLKSEYFNPIDTIIPTGFGLRKNINLRMYRDNTFALYKGIVYDPDMNPLEGVEVKVGDSFSRTDSAGAFSISIPLDKQRIELPVNLSKEGYEPVAREDESPGEDLKYVMHK